MRYYVIINGVNSLTIQGLAISKLPSISKPMMRNMREEIDGRDGDITTELGYGAYDKSLEIGLFGNYDINEIIAFFNSKGTIVFSDEPDKYYNFEILEKIDFEKLLKFKTAIVSIHCQPFKYPLTETPQEIEYDYVSASGDNLSINNTAEAQIKSVQLDGQTSQTGTPTPTSPQDVHVVSGDNTITITGKNRFTPFIKGIAILSSNGAQSTSTKSGATDFIPISFANNETYYLSGLTNTLNSFIASYNKDKEFLGRTNGTAVKNWYLQGNSFISGTPQGTGDIAYIRITQYYLTGNTGTIDDIDNLTPQLENGNQATEYEPHVEAHYDVDLGVVNLFDKTDIITGSRVNSANGTFGTVSHINRSNYINVKGMKYIYLDGNETSQNYTSYLCAFYDSNQTYISGQTTTMNQPFYNGKINVPNNAEYFIFNFYDGDLNSIKLTKGKEAQKISSSPIELCKIGDYKDKFFKGKGYNLLDRTACVENTILKWADGLENSLSNGLASDYIKVEKFEKYIQNYSSQLCFYDINKNYLGCMQTGGNQIAKGTGDYFSSFTIPNVDGIYYMRLGYRPSFGGNPANMLDKFIMLNKGTTLQPLEPYDAKNKWVLEKRIGKKELTSIGSSDGVSGNTLYVAFSDRALSSSSNQVIYCDKLGFSVNANSVSSANNNMSNLTIAINNNGTSKNVFIKNTALSTSSAFTTWLENITPIVYYQLEIPILTLIDDEVLISQLDALANGSSYETQTNISQENNDLPFYLEIDVMKNGTNKAVINNEGNIYSKPTIALVGTGIVNIYLNGVQMFQVDLSETKEITIDTEHMEAYNPNDNTLANRKVIGDYSKFKLDVGNNTIKIDGALTSATITNYKRWL